MLHRVHQLISGCVYLSVRFCVAILSSVNKKYRLGQLYIMVPSTYLPSLLHYLCWYMIWICMLTIYGFSSIDSVQFVFAKTSETFHHCVLIHFIWVHLKHVCQLWEVFIFSCPHLLLLSIATDLMQSIIAHRLQTREERNRDWNREKEGAHVPEWEKTSEMVL